MISLLLSRNTGVAKQLVDHVIEQDTIAKCCLKQFLGCFRAGLTYNARRQNGGEISAELVRLSIVGSL